MYRPKRGRKEPNSRKETEKEVTEMQIEDVPQYETDFLKLEGKIPSWDELEVGEEYQTTPFVLTEERIRAYAEGTDDFNPVYFDNEYARKLGFSGRIAPPTIVVPIVFAASGDTSWLKMPGAINPGQKLEFGVPARPGDTIYCRSRLIDKYIKRNKKYTVAEMIITNDKGELICKWTGGLILPR